MIHVKSQNSESFRDFWVRAHRPFGRACGRNGGAGGQLSSIQSRPLQSCQLVGQLSGLFAPRKIDSERGAKTPTLGACGARLGRRGAHLTAPDPPKPATARLFSFMCRGRFPPPSPRNPRCTADFAFGRAPRPPWASLRDATDSILTQTTKTPTFVFSVRPQHPPSSRDALTTTAGQTIVLL